KSEHGPPWYIWRYDPATCVSSQVSRDNGNPNVLNWGESWSPTRDRIAFVRDGAGLMVMNADGTRERMLLAAQSATTQSSGAWTSWSPDGKRIAFAGRTDGLWVVDVATGKATNIVNDGNVRAVSWSPNGSAIAFDLGGRITSVKPDGTGRKDIGPGADADWGPDGRIAFTSLSGGGVAVMNADGTGVKKVVDDSTAGAPAWSPDGKLLVFSSVSAGISVINADGSGKRLLVPDGDHNTQPTW
ncbi:MAG TPA: hypothetical protein VFA96_02395, partial [Nocardioides sp.]|nr:hypothetical protein [Nocardioides sp.]